MCFLAYILIRRYAIMRSSGQRPFSDSTISSAPCGFIPSAEQLNDSLYELYKPLDTPPRMCVIFLHGLQSGDDRDPHLSTWKSGDESCLWPQTWLTEKFPGAHVLSVSYTAHVGKNVQGDFDIYSIGENLLSDILQVNIGQAPYCPVILVGHCFGGFVIKQLCNHAYERFNRASDQKTVKVKLANFLKNIRGIFYYGTPHHGSPLMNKEVHHLGRNLLKYFPLLSKGGARLNDKFAQSSLLTYFKLLSKEGARLNENFEQLRGLNPKWQIHGLGESLSTKSGLFQGVVGAPEASSRAGDSFNVVEADHIQICRPEKKTSRSFYGLVEVLESIATDVKKEEARAQEEKTLAAEKSSLQNLKYLPKQIMGIKVPIQTVQTKLVESRTLGLVGMGGCGKTTLAKAIFNNLGRRFEYSAFKLDVKLISGGEDDLKEKVWSQMHHFGEQMTIKPMWSLLSGKSLLLVLDDVSSGRDLEVLFDIAKDLSPESRFLVTSRDRDLLTRLDDMYTVPFLKPIIARELFITYAFPEQDAPPSELESLVGAIVEKCDGLPLTLEIIGKYLHKRVDKQDWEQTLIALGRADSVTGLNEKLWEKLKVSFTGLQEEEQKIFLDVATFFCRNPNCTLGEAKVAWKAAYALSNERLLWRTLVDRSLVYDVQESETIQMHEQLLDLGRKIGAKQLKIRRVWDQEEAMGVFQSTLQRHDEEIFALRLHLNEAPQQTLTTSRRALLCLKDVRYLDVEARATIHGDQEDKVEPFLTNLVFVNLRGVHQHLIQVLFDSSILTRLVILHLSNYDGEGLPKSISDLSALKILKLYSCLNLHSLPESFGQLSALTNLWFYDCKKLQTLPESFGHLSVLTNLQFKGCHELQTLPESFGHLSTLTNLQFEGCHELQTLPESFGQLSVLTNLRFSNCQKLQTLPESFGHLSALTTLRFTGCHELQTLPESFGHLSSLTNLQFSFCRKLQTLSKSFGHLSALTNLQFTSCHELQTLPESFGQLLVLTDLQFSNCQKLQALPESFGHLSALTTLRFTGCHELQTLPESFGHLLALTTLRFFYCEKLQTLPESFGHLSALTNLEFPGCHELHTLPESFGHLSALTKLQFSNFQKLQTLPESFGQLWTLTNLEFDGCHELQSLPESFGHLSALTKLQFSNFQKLQTLPESFGHLSALTNLLFSNCQKLQTLPESFGQLWVLTNLEFDGCHELQSLPESFGHLSALTNLGFYDCEKLQTLPESFGHLLALTKLQFRGCCELQTFPESFGHLSALTNLWFSYCLKLETLPESFGHLSALTKLGFYDCEKLQTLPESFGHLLALTNLQFRGCRELQTFPESFGHLLVLTNLEFIGCHELQTLPESFGHLSALTNLRFSYCQKLHTLPESFGHLSALTNLRFQLCAKLQTLPDTFGQLSALQHLHFCECETFCALSGSFGQLTKLEDLKISDCLRLDILPNSFAELTALRHLSIENVALTIVPGSIRSLPSLQVLELGCLPFVKEFPPWLGEAEAGLRRMSINIFHVQDRNFSLRAQHTLDEADKERLTTGLLILALQRVRSSNLVRRCDECGMYPLEWPRYESFTRFHYTLCPKCFQQSGSNATEYNCVDCPVHPSVRCDGCKMFPLKGPRYKSSTRSDFDLCHDCFQRSGNNASEYNCFDPPILSAGDGTTDILNLILALDADDRSSEIHWSSKRVLNRVVIFQERGVLKRLVGDLLGALEDVNKALEIGLSHTSSDFDFRKNHGNLWYECLKHRAYVKFLLGDLYGARRDAQEALSVTRENIAPGRRWGNLEFAIRRYSLGAYSVKFLGFERK